MKLTLYLIADHVQTFEDAVIEAKLEPIGDFSRIEVINVDLDAVAYIQTDRKAIPKWLPHFRPYLSIPSNQEIFNTSNSLLILFRQQGHMYALSQGYGYVLLKRQAVTKNFGLRTTLNAINPEKIRCLDWRNVDTVTKQVRTVLNSDCALSEFDIDAQQDLLRYASGQPVLAHMGTRMQGSDSLSCAPDLSFPDIPSKCAELYELYSADTYREHFGFIDNMQRVTDANLCAILDQSLAGALASSQTEKMSLAYPELLRWDMIDHFRITGAYRRATIPEANLDSLYCFLEEFPQVPRDPHRIHILALDEDDQPVSQRFELHDYIVFETQHEGDTYILSLGAWFRVNDDYIQRVNQQAANIPEITALSLPPIRRGEWERHYNSRAAAASPSLILLDRDTITITGASKVEVCDLLSSDWHFIHVKRESYSATLSHLFSQGSVSAALLCTHRPYREQILAQIPPNWEDPPFTAAAAGDHRQMTIVYAIPSAAPGPLASSLPFFSKVNLLQHCEALQRMGFPHGLRKIDYT